MGSVFKKTATKPLPAGTTIIVRKGQRLNKAGRRSAYLGLRLVPDPVPPKPTPESRARPMLAKRKPRRNAKSPVSY